MRSQVFFPMASPTSAREYPHTELDVHAPLYVSHSSDASFIGRATDHGSAVELRW